MRKIEIHQINFKKELTPEWLENRQYKKPNIFKSNIIENDENFNKEVAAFKDKLNKSGINHFD